MSVEDAEIEGQFEANKVTFSINKPQLGAVAPTAPPTAVEDQLNCSVAAGAKYKLQIVHFLNFASGD